MRATIRRLAGLGIAVLLVMLAAAACGEGAGSPSSPAATPAGSRAPAASDTPGASASHPSLTPVPGGATQPTPAGPTPTTTTTKTDWGTILDAVPASFPVYPGAEATDAVDGPASGAWTVQADAGTVSAWYADALAAAGYSSNDRSGPLEDGSYTVDTRSDVPECRIRTTVRPQGDLTMITVLFGAGCVALGG
jgi:hypothetical protein